MNFFGHAVVASRICADPEFVLGSMLPDFEGMVAESATRFISPRVFEGVRTHHATDHVFHSSEPFLRHQAKARVELQSKQVRTGPRRAVAHVGVELLLDAALGAATHRTDCYKSALQAGLQPSVLAGAPFMARAKLSTLLTSLRARAAYVVPKTPLEVAQRLERIFAARPALSLRAGELPVVTEWVHRAWAPIAAEAEAWLTELVDSATRHLNATSFQTNEQQAPLFEASTFSTAPESELL